jgi:hypothetical protein
MRPGVYGPTVPCETASIQNPLDFGSFVSLASGKCLKLETATRPIRADGMTTFSMIDANVARADA